MVDRINKVLKPIANPPPGAAPAAYDPEDPVNIADTCVVGDTDGVTDLNKMKYIRITDDQRL